MRTILIAAPFLLVLISRPERVPGRENPAALEVSRRARALQPGEVIQLEVRSPRALASVEAGAFGRSHPFFADPDAKTWRGLVGIDLETKPGAYSIEIRVSDSDGRPIVRPYPLVVRSKVFPSRRLTVDEKFVTPPAEAQERIRKESERVAAVFGAVTRKRLWDGAFQQPVPGTPISSFGKRSILNGVARSPHSGTDFRAKTGTPIRAPNRGRIALTADLYFSGNTVIVDHGLGLYTYYAHLSEILVREGEMVEGRRIIGRAGSTGRATGPHLHWSVRLVGARVDPMSLAEMPADATRESPGK